MTDAELRAWLARLEWEWRLAEARRREAAWDAEWRREWANEEKWRQNAESGKITPTE